MTAAAVLSEIPSVVHPSAAPAIPRALANETLESLPEIPFEPLASKILVLRDASVERTPGGIFIPDVAKTAKKEGIVLAVGPGRWSMDAKRGNMRADRVPPSVKRGDRVFWSKYAGAGFPIWDLVFKDKDGRDRVVVMLTDESLVGMERGGELVPLFNNVFVRRKLPDDTTKGGIVIPDIAKTSKPEGQIVAIGPGGWDDLGHNRLLATTAKVGQNIRWVAGFENHYECLQRYARAGEEILTLLDDEVVCVVEHEPEYDPC